MKHLTYVILSFVVASILVMLSLSAAVTSVFAQFGYPDQRVVWDLVTVSTLISLFGGIVTFGALIRNRRAMQFADEVVDELLKVTWPTREETVRASVTVVATTAFVAALLAFYDYVWKNLADIFLFTQS